MGKWRLLPIGSKMKRKITYLILFLIIVIASILRLWRIGDVPISPDWDEVALGYNAYSIMQTGRDEYGEFFPIILRSFDDYKPALYAYLIIPFIKIFDLTVFAVRLPSAIFGILTVLGVFFLIKELFSLEIKKQDLNKQLIIALLVSGLLAVSPWHIQFSRIAFESNVGLAFNVFAALLFLLALRKPWLLTVSAFFMSINLYVYQSEKVFTPLLLIALLTIFRRELSLIPKKYIVTAIMLGIVISLPIAYYTLSNREALSRAKDVSILANTTPFLHENAQRIIQDRARHDYFGLLLDNRRITYLKTISASYLSHFDLNWLFIKGDIARHHAPSMGLLYLWELPFLLIGMYTLLFGSFSLRTKALVIMWFLIAPVPASITSDVPHAVRTLNFLPMFQVFTALGILSVMYRISNIKLRNLFIASYLLLIIFNFLYYLNQYFVQQNYFHAKYWQYGYKEIVEYLVSTHAKYDKIIVSNEQPFDQSYMFFLFYSKYDPVKYFKKGGTKSGIQEEDGNKFLNFEFRAFNYYTEQGSNILFVGSSDDFTEIFKTVRRIDYPNGEVAIRVVHKD